MNRLLIRSIVWIKSIWTKNIHRIQQAWRDEPQRIENDRYKWRTTQPGKNCVYYCSSFVESSKHEQQSCREIEADAVSESWYLFTWKWSVFSCVKTPKRLKDTWADPPCPAPQRWQTPINSSVKGLDDFGKFKTVLKSKVTSRWTFEHVQEH